jgi:hypothetical protein
MYQNSLNQLVTLPNPSNEESNIIEAGIRNYKRSAYVTIIGNEPGHYGALVGIIELNNAHSLNWLQNNISPIPNCQILLQDPHQTKQDIRNYINNNANFYLWTIIDEL